MRVTIFGGTGRTGRHIVEQALAAGHDVTALVRSPAKVKALHPRLTVMVGELSDAGLVERAVSGADAVVSALGPTENKPPYTTTAATESILAAMRKTGVRRLVVTAGAGIDDSNDRPRMPNHLIKVLLKTFARHIYKDMAGVVDLVRASGLDWTVVRAPRLTDIPHTGRIRVGYVGGGVGGRLSRADFADFVVTQLSDTAHIHCAPAISN